MSQFQAHSGRDNADLTTSSLYDISGHVAVVTGGGSGIGLMITQALAVNGAKVYIVGRTKAKLDTVVEKYSKKGSSKAGEIVAVPGDISNKAGVSKIVEAVKAKEKAIHLLVNNSGITDQNQDAVKGGDFDKSSAEAYSSHYFKNSSFEAWNETLNTNITSHFFTSMAFLPLLAAGTASKPGYSSSIVNVASISGIMKGTSGGQYAYSTSKAAVLHLSKMLAADLVDTKIRVNSISPGLFPSEMTEGESNEDQKSKLEGKGQGLPAHRTGDDRDMASCILFLASPGAQFVNGQDIHPDGGALLINPSTA